MKNVTDFRNGISPILKSWKGPFPVFQMPRKKIHADSVINFHPLPVMGGFFELTEEIRT